MNAPPGPIASRDRPTCSEWCPGGVRPGLHPQRPDPGSVKTWPLSRPTRTPRPRIPSRLGEDLVHGDGKRAPCRSLPAPPGRSLAAPPAFSCGRGMRWDGPAPLQSGNANRGGRPSLPERDVVTAPATKRRRTPRPRPGSGASSRRLGRKRAARDGAPAPRSGTACLGRRCGATDACLPSEAGPPPGWAFFCGVQMMAGQVAIMPDDALARVKSALSEELRRHRHVEPEQVHGPSKNVGSLSDCRRARS